MLSSNGEKQFNETKKKMQEEFDEWAKELDEDEPFRVRVGVRGRGI